jgi:hypothetical protein
MQQLNQATACSTAVLAAFIGNYCMTLSSTPAAHLDCISCVDEHVQQASHAMAHAIHRQLTNLPLHSNSATPSS